MDVILAVLLGVGSKFLIEVTGPKKAPFLNVFGEIQKLCYLVLDFKMFTLFSRIVFNPINPSKIIVNVLNFFIVNRRMVDQQVMSTQIRSHYLYWAEKVHNVIVLCGVLGTRNRDL